MQLYPAIDIKNGACVRLQQGIFDNSKVYSQAPGEIAKLWESQGGTYLHVVDLDGALNGHTVNFDAIRQIRESVSMPIQLGGGIRSIKNIDDALNLGITRVIIGTKAVTEPGFVKECLKLFNPEQIVIGIDAKDGMVAIDGWGVTSAVSATSLAKSMADLGVRHIVYTDISKDGMLQGPNVRATKELTDLTGIDVIASGGVSSIGDLAAIQEAGIQGAIIGKALYEQRIFLPEAIRRFQK